MNLAASVKRWFRAFPTGMRGTTKVTHTDGRTMTVEAMGAAAKGTLADAFDAASMIRDKNRQLVILPGSFAPLADMSLTWEGLDWTITAVAPVAPGGKALAYQVTVTR